MKHRIACVAIAALAFSAPVAFARVPQPEEEGCEFTAIECNNISYLEEGTWVPGTMTWAPNRLPAAMISFRPGVYCSGTGGNYTGVQGWWYDQDYGSYDDGDGKDPFQELSDRITDAYSSGYRRIILNLPAGSVRGQDFPASQWWPMPQAKREELACLILNWLEDHADTQFEVYAGFPINDPDSLCMSASNNYSVPTIEAETCGTLPEHGYMYYPCAGSGTAHPPSPFVQADVCDFHRNIDPWQQLGITRYWLDGSTGEWSDFIELAYCPLYAPGAGQHYLGAEAFPQESYPGPIDLGKARLCPAIIFQNQISIQDEDKLWGVSDDASETELIVVVDYTDTDYFDINHMVDVLEWTQRGFVLAAQSSASALLPAQFTEYMKRVYGFGTISNRRDFNGDGLLNSADLDDFEDMHAVYLGRSNCNWVHGDVNGDHRVTSSDALLYRHWYLNQAGVGPPYQANLGTANPETTR